MVRVLARLARLRGAQEEGEARHHHAAAAVPVADPVPAGRLAPLRRGQGGAVAEVARVVLTRAGFHAAAAAAAAAGAAGGDGPPVLDAAALAGDAAAAASVAALEALPGIGHTRAQAIVDDRLLNGDFDSVEDLTRVRGIGPATVQALHPFVTTR